MSKIIFTLSFLCCTIWVFGQVPQSIKYQAAARDVENNPIKNREIDIRLTIFKGSIQGEDVYRELHRPKTSDLGIFSFNIGDGDADIGAFELIEWGTNDFFLQVEMDADDDGIFALMGISQFLSVPYSLYADRSGSADNDFDTSPENEIQTLQYDEFTNELSLSGANAILLPAIPLNNDDDSSNELQDLSLDGTELSISDGNTINLQSLLNNFNTDNQSLSIIGTNLVIDGGNSVDLSLIQDGVDDADSNPLNEIQGLSISGTQLTLSQANTINLQGAINSLERDNQSLFFDGNNLTIENGNIVNLSSLRDGVTDADSNPNNELQDLSLNGTVLEIEGGNQVDLAGIIPPGGTDNQTLTLIGTELSIEDGNMINLGVLQDGVNDADSNPNNEIQNLSLNGTEILISSGNSVDIGSLIPPGGTDDQNLNLNGTLLEIEGGNEVDLAGIILPGGTDNQTLTLIGTELSIEDGNMINLGVLQDGVNDADSNPNNEIQNLSLNGTEILISGGNSVDIGSLIPPGGTDDQNLNLNGTLLEIEGGNEVDLAGIIPPGGTDNQTLSLTGTELSIEDGNMINLGVLQDGVDDADNDPMNEFQNLNLSGTILSIENGNTVNLNGLQDGVNDADSNPNNELIQDIFINNSILSIIEGGNVFSVDLTNTQNSIWEQSLDTAIYNQGDVKVLNNLIVDDDIYLENSDNPCIEIYTPSDEVIQTPWGMNIYNGNGTNLDIALRSDWIGSNMSVYSRVSNSPAVDINSYNFDGGTIRLLNNQGANRIIQNVTNVDNGIMTLYGENGTINAQIASYDNFPSFGVFTAHNSAGSRVSEIGIAISEAGYMATFGNNQQLNTNIGHIRDFPNNGSVAVFGPAGNPDGNNIPEAHMYVDANGQGRIEADIKNFVTDHPRDPNKEIVYTSLEGPEAGAYERGTATLTNGEAFVPFSEHFQLIINESTMTVSLTPLSANTFGLAVIEKNARGFRVKELMGRTGNFSFDWEVKAVRKGYENLEVIRKKGKYVPVKATGLIQKNSSTKQDR